MTSDRSIAINSRERDIINATEAFPDAGKTNTFSITKLKQKGGQ
ncbi:hypothetical protein IQ31_03650 [Sphingobacterium siyangense]|uniref:Uncharacterized protein n=1 Tax=Sphingobacterium siyangense TaxID=459529 RepID=A0A562MC80_9SPHI|nr:hypothetical protein IQ31_03650 [Sphingobacterium siyangense]